jgi:tRNA pseudouridine55 synthase
VGRSRKGRSLSGFLIVDKPAGITSTAVVGKVRWTLEAQKAGHAGTLDPAATGLLAVALGEATKVLPLVTDALKAYEFTVRWGIEDRHRRREGAVLRESDRRPAAEAVEAALAGFRGDILQVPPAFSAVKVDGERAYDLAREGEEFTLAARSLYVTSFRCWPSPTPTARSCGWSAARAATCARSRATSAAPWAASAMWRACGGCGRGPSRCRTR